MLQLEKFEIHKFSFEYYRQLYYFLFKKNQSVNDLIMTTLTKKVVDFSSLIKDNSFLERYEKAYHNELVHFIKSVQTGVKPSVDIADGVLALRIAEAAQKSLKTGNPVNL